MDPIEVVRDVRGLDSTDDEFEVPVVVVVVDDIMSVDVVVDILP